MLGAPLTVGTAGHIDHGKTELVRGLTGVDTDRLPEEKRRGITIVLGYAPLRLPSGRVVSLIDVPGHERLIRTMVSPDSRMDIGPPIAVGSTFSTAPANLRKVSLSFGSPVGCAWT